MPDVLALVLPLFVAGLLGGVTHCVGMCGPFVLTQVGARLEALPAGGFGGLARLRGGALLPYQFGRLTTYTLLGATAGGIGGAFVQATEYRWPLAVLLLAGAAVLAGQAIGWQTRLPLGGVADGVSRLSRPLLIDPRGWRGYRLGVLLGFLPCGLLYGALAVAAGSGTVTAGAAGMLAFGVGTMPALVAVGWGGAALGVRRRELLARLSRPLLAINALVLGALAVRILV